MTEIQKLLRFYHDENRDGSAAALATLVHVEGSSYRRPGARMIILEDGRWIGSVSGGCLEGDVRDRAVQCMSGGNAVRVQYDTRDDAGSVFGLAMGCDGIVDVLIEPISPVEPITSIANAYSNVLTRLERLSNITEPSIHIVSMTNPTRPTMSVWSWFGTEKEMEESSMVSDMLRAQAIDCLHAGRSRSFFQEIDGQQCEILVEVLQPQPRLVIFGAGYDAVALTSLAQGVGWHVSVFDKAAGKVVPERFPQADVVQCVVARDAGLHIEIPHRTACVIMSHNIPYDAEVLSQILGRSPQYIGVLGPHARMQKLRFHMENVLNVDTTTLPFSVVYSPIGLDLGAETPEEIALSIVAQILGVMRERDARHLREKPGRIHEH